MSSQSTNAELINTAELQADLTDLLQLEFDALPMYAMAISALQDPILRSTLSTYRQEHERHAQALKALLDQMGATPPHFPHLPTGIFKLGVQAIGLPGGDRAVLLAFVANEWQSREKYARYAAKSYPPALKSLVASHAADEAKHYEWACEALRHLGCGEDTVVGKATHAFARFHGTVADVIEGAGRAAQEAAIRTFGRL
jgi:rubrerythrin